MEQIQITRPDKVGTALKLIYTSFGIGVIRIPIDASSMAVPISPLFLAIGAAILFGVLLFFTFMIGNGHNWARIILLILVIIGVPLSIQTLIQTFSIRPISGLFEIVQTAIEIVAMVFLFQRPSSDWFKAIKVTKQQRTRKQNDEKLET